MKLPRAITGHNVRHRFSPLAPKLNTQEIKMLLSINVICIHETDKWAVDINGNQFVWEQYQQLPNTWTKIGNLLFNPGNLRSHSVEKDPENNKETHYITLFSKTSKIIPIAETIQIDGVK